MAGLNDILINIKANTTQAQQEISKLEGSFKAFKEVAGGITLALAGIGIAAKEAFEFGKEGAELLRTREQLDNLAASIDTTSDAIINRMGEATGGMMSNADMIRSATDIISLGLADNETDVVRLASVVGELGLNMSDVILTMANDSKMRLDALGLSVEDVEGRMKKFTDQGIVMEKAFDMAVLEALEARVKLLGPAADTAAGAFQRLENHILNAADASKMEFAEAVEPAVKGAADLLDVSKKVNNARKEGIVTMGQSISIIERLRWGIIDENEALRELIILTGEANTEMSEAVPIAESFDRKLLNMAESADDGAVAFGELANGAELTGSAAIYAEQAIEDAAEAMDYTARVAEEAAAASMDFSSALDDVSTARPSAISSLVEDVQFLIAGGGAVIQLMQDVNAAIADPNIGMEQVEASLEAALVASLKVEVEADQTSVSDAKKTLRDTLGWTWAEANEAWAEFDNAADAVAHGERILKYGADIAGAMTELSALETYADDMQSSEWWLEFGADTREAETDIQELETESENVARQWLLDFEAETDAAKNRVDTLEDAARDAAGTYNLKFNITTSGSIPGAGSGGNPGLAFHHGADFVVPPGYPSDTFGPLFVESGERVQVTPAAEMDRGGGGGGGGVPNVIVMLDSREIAAAVDVQTGRNFRTARQAGAALTGR